MILKFAFLNFIIKIRDRGGDKMKNKLSLCLGAVLAFAGLFSLFSQNGGIEPSKDQASPNKDVTRNGEDEGVVLFKFPGR